MPEPVLSRNHFCPSIAYPAKFIAGIETPLVIDEVQRLRKAFLAIREDVDRNRQLGRKLSTGSADDLTIPEDELRHCGEIVGRIFENFVVLELFKHAS